MRLIVAGAGAGKTTSMAQLVLDRFQQITDNKIIYVVTYTNAARDHIRSKIKELYGNIPKTIFVETIHSFLLNEIIFPFHHSLYEQNFKKVSFIKLPENYGFKAKKIKELASDKIIHVQSVTEYAKWIIYKKSSDNNNIKVKRSKILAIISRYMDSIFIDECQDMDKHFAKLVEIIDAKGIDITLIGDPKQDLRGRNTLSNLIDKYKGNVIYKKENYRCPITHVKLSNKFVSDEEKQIPQKSHKGCINYVLESKIDINSFIKNNWDLAYIYNKNNRIITHPNDETIKFKNLIYELSSIVKKSNMSEKDIDIFVYHINKDILNNLRKFTNYQIFTKLENALSIALTLQDKGKIASALNLCREDDNNEGIFVNSIDSIKGLEGEQCLFILTTNLVSYLFEEKRERNKMLNYLYVALTRSKNILTLLITTEVEKKYGVENIKKVFKEYEIVGI